MAIMESIQNKKDEVSWVCDYMDLTRVNLRLNNYSNDQIKQMPPGDVILEGNILLER